MTHDPNALCIYIDGSAFNNPGGKGGMAGLAIFPDELGYKEEEIFQVGFIATTNNRMELLACIEALKFARKAIEKPEVNRIIIYSDSEYVVNHQNIASFWKKNNWRNRNNRKIENPKAWDDFLKARQKVPADIFLIPGKSTPATKTVDKLAKHAANSPIRKRDLNFHGGRVAPAKTAGGGASSLFPASEQVEVIRIYRHRAIDENEYKVIFDLFSEDENKYIAKHRAYILTEERDFSTHHCYKVQFNEDPQYPIMEILKEVNCPIESGDEEKVEK